MNANILLDLPYCLNLLLLAIGLYGIIATKNLVKQLIGLNIFQASVILFFILFAYKSGGTVPIWDETLGTTVDRYINPLPHALMLTAIVVSVATTGVALTLIRKIHHRFQSLEEPEILNDTSTQ